MRFLCFFMLLFGGEIIANSTTPLAHKKDAATEVKEESEANRAQVLRDQSIVKKLNTKLAQRFFKILRCSNAKKSTEDSRWEEVYEMKQALREWKNAICKLKPSLAFEEVHVENEIQDLLKKSGVENLSRTFNRWLQGEPAFDDMLKESAQGLSCDKSSNSDNTTLARALGSNTELVKKFDAKFNDYVQKSDLFELKGSIPCKGDYSLSTSEVAISKNEIDKIQNESLAQAKSEREKAESSAKRVSPQQASTQLTVSSASAGAQTPEDANTSDFSQFHDKPAKSDVLLKDQIAEEYEFYYGKDDSDTAKKQTDRVVKGVVADVNENHFMNRGALTTTALSNKLVEIRAQHDQEIRAFMIKQENSGLSQGSLRERYDQIRSMGYGKMLAESERLDKLQELYGLQQFDSPTEFKVFVHVYNDLSSSQLDNYIRRAREREPTTAEAQ